MQAFLIIRLLSTLIWAGHIVVLFRRKKSLKNMSIGQRFLIVSALIDIIGFNVWTWFIWRSTV